MSDDGLKGQFEKISDTAKSAPDEGLRVGTIRVFVQRTVEITEMHWLEEQLTILIIPTMRWPPTRYRLTTLMPHER
jgi:hypothetical protein